MSQRNAGKITVPDDLRDVLLEFTISYLLEQPGDIIDYAVDFFTRLRDARRTQIINTDQIYPTTPDEFVDEGESWERARCLSLFPVSLSFSFTLSIPVSVSRYLTIRGDSVNNACPQEPTV